MPKGFPTKIRGDIPGFKNLFKRWKGFQNTSKPNFAHLADSGFYDGLKFSTRSYPKGF